MMLNFTNVFEVHVELSDTVPTHTICRATQIDATSLPSTHI